MKKIIFIILFLINFIGLIYGLCVLKTENVIVGFLGAICSISCLCDEF